MTKPVSSFRIDPELLKKAHEAGLSVIDIIEAALAKALEYKKCPYCNKELESKR